MFLQNNLADCDEILQDEETKEALCRSVFAIIDANNDGYISYVEFKDFMDYLSSLIGKLPLSERNMAKAYSMIASNEDGKITYNEIKHFISDFVYIITSQPEPKEGEISEDPYILKKMIKKLKKQVQKKR